MSIENNVNNTPVVSAEPSKFATALNTAKTKITNAKDAVKTKIINAKDTVATKASELGATIKTKASEASVAIKEKAAQLKEKAVVALGDLPANAKAAALSSVNVRDQRVRAAKAVAYVSGLGESATSSPASIVKGADVSVKDYIANLFKKFSETAPDASQAKKAAAAVKGSLQTIAAASFYASGVAGNAVFKVVNNLSAVIGPLGSSIAVLAGFITRAVVLAIVSGLTAVAVAVGTSTSLAAPVVATAISVAIAAVMIPIGIVKGDTIFLGYKNHQLSKKVEELSAQVKTLQPKEEAPKAPVSYFQAAKDNAAYYYNAAKTKVFG